MTVTALTGCQKKEASTSEPGERQLPVTVCRIKAVTLKETVRGIGSLKATETVEVRPEVSGILESVHFQEGRTVEKGDLLFSVDDTQLRHQKTAREAALSAARARLKNARRRFERIRTLYDRKTVSEDERDQAETAFETARADVSRLEAEVQLTAERLADTEIRAPFTGIPAERQVDPGDYVSVGTHLVTLYRASHLEIAFTVPERYMGRVQEGQPVTTRVDAYPDRTFGGTVGFVAPNINLRTRDFLVKAEIANDANLLKPGAFGTAVVTVDTRENVLAVPEDALIPLRGGYMLFAVEDNTARAKRVQTGLREGIMVEVSNGLEAGATVVQSGQIRLSDGARVKIVEDESCERQTDNEGAAGRREADTGSRAD